MAVFPMIAAQLMAAAASSSPIQHVLLTVIDDLGYDDLGFRNQGQIKTPTFNTLHDEGVDLSAYYVQPSCSPTRAAILTGRKPLHTGINFWLPNIAAGLALSEVTLADVLNRRNFTSHAVGKYAHEESKSGQHACFRRPTSAPRVPQVAPWLPQDAIHVMAPTPFDKPFEYTLCQTTSATAHLVLTLSRGQANVPRLLVLLRLLRGLGGLLLARYERRLRLPRRA